LAGFSGCANARRWRRSQQGDDETNGTLHGNHHTPRDRLAVHCFSHAERKDYFASLPPRYKKNLAGAVSPISLLRHRALR
jgi:hypothetical protein